MPQLLPALVAQFLLIASPGIAQDDAADRPSMYQAALAATEKAIRLDETGEARRWLDAARPELRGWEWRHLDAAIRDSIDNATTPTRITALAVTPDGTIITGDLEGTVCVRDSHLRVLRSRALHDNAIYSIDVSPDGTRFATVSRDVTSRVWNLETLEEVTAIALDNPGVAAVAFAPDGQRAATCTWTREGDPLEVHGIVWVWDTGTGTVMHRQRVGIKPLDSITWTPDGSRIIVGSWDGIVHVLDHEATELTRLIVPHEDMYTAVVAVDVSTDGRLVAAGSKDHTARVWELETGALHATMKGHSNFVNDIAFEADGARLVTAGGDATIRRWSVESGKQLSVHREHVRSVDEIALVSGDTLVSASRDGTVRRWSLDGQAGAQTKVNTDTGGAYTATLTPDGRRVVVAGFNGRVLVIDALAGRVEREWLAHDGSSCNTLSMTADGQRLLTSSWDTTAKLWDAESQELLGTFNAGGGVYHGEISPGGTHAALAVGEKLQVWEIESGTMLAELAAHAERIADIRFSPDGQLIYTAGGDGTVGVWHTERPRLLRSVSVPNATPLGSVAISHDGERLAAGDGSGAVHCWTADGDLLWSTRVSDRGINRLAFTPDGQRLAAGSDAVDILEATSGAALLRIRPHADTVWHLSFSSDGERLATSSTNGTVTISTTKAASASH